MEKASIYYLEFNLICVFILVRPLNRMPLLVLDVSGLGHCHIELHVLELEGSALLDSLSHHVGVELLAHEGLHVALSPLNASQVLKELSIGQSDAVVELTFLEVFSHGIISALSPREFGDLGVVRQMYIIFGRTTESEVRKERWEGSLGPLCGALNVDIVHPNLLDDDSGVLVPLVLGRVPVVGHPCRIRVDHILLLRHRLEMDVRVKLDMLVVPVLRRSRRVIDDILTHVGKCAPFVHFGGRQQRSQARLEEVGYWLGGVALRIR